MNYILTLLVILFIVGLFSNENKSNNTNNNFGFDDCYQDDNLFDDLDNNYLDDD